MLVERPNLRLTHFKAFTRKGILEPLLGRAYCDTLTSSDCGCSFGVSHEVLGNVAFFYALVVAWCSSVFLVEGQVVQTLWNAAQNFCGPFVDDFEHARLGALV